MNFLKGDSYPYTEADLRRDNPRTSFPMSALQSDDIRADYGVSVVADSEKPSQSGHKAVEVFPTLQDGSYVQTWELVLKAPNEVHTSEIVHEPPVQEGFVAEPTEPEWIDGQWKMQYELVAIGYEESRKGEYGTPESQIEFITENGLEAWQTKVAEIKAKYPK